jgi:hypothetical protein
MTSFPSSSTGQAGWRWCLRCFGLSFAVLLASGCEPKTVRHDNELGEYVFANTESLAIEPYLFPQKELDKLQEQTASRYSEYQRCYQDIGLVLGKDSCKEIWLNAAYEEQVGRQEKLQELADSQKGGLKKPSIITIRWRGIAKAVGSERAKVEETVYCFDPKLSPESRALWENASQAKHPMPDSEDRDDLMNKVEADLCSRYAKF